MGSVSADILLQAEASAWWLGAGLLMLGVALLYGVQGAQIRRRLRSKLIATRSQLNKMHQHDPLTGLVTREEFETQLELAASEGDRGQGSLALLYLGLDNFRAVNEAYGLHVGDSLLVQAADRLLAFVGDPAHAARAAGDEFVLLLRVGLADALAAAARLQELLSLPFTVEALPLQLSVSVGISVYPDDGARPRLMAYAAIAMRTVKHGGGASHAHYDVIMVVDMREQAELLQDLRHAIARNELRLYYQPKIDARTLQITAAEALLRWHHPRRGMVSPAVFVPLAERHGLISSIGLWVIEEACRQAALWREADLRMRIAVNISGHQLRGDDLVDQIQASLRRYRIPSDRLTCEITESVAMEDTAVTRDAFERLRRAGLHVSIDDFGTGHSSLAALRQLPAAELKIDRAFVTDLAASEVARSIVRAVVQMAHSLRLRVVAEGVETEAQRDELVRLGCDELQGYLFAKPMTATALASWAAGDGPATGSMFSPSLFEPTARAPLQN